MLGWEFVGRRSFRYLSDLIGTNSYTTLSILTCSHNIPNSSHHFGSTSVSIAAWSSSHHRSSWSQTSSYRVWSRRRHRQCCLMVTLTSEGKISGMKLSRNKVAYLNSKVCDNISHTHRPCILFERFCMVMYMIMDVTVADNLGVYNLKTKRQSSYVLVKWPHVSL